MVSKHLIFLFCVAFNLSAASDVSRRWTAEQDFDFSAYNPYKSVAEDRVLYECSKGPSVQIAEFEQTSFRVIRREIQEGWTCRAKCLEMVDGEEHYVIGVLATVGEDFITTVDEDGFLIEKARCTLLPGSIKPE